MFLACLMGAPFLTMSSIGVIELKVIVLGGGVIGLLTSYYLVKSNVEVLLVERESGVGQGASNSNGCQLSYSFVDALGSPSTLKKIPGIVMGLDPYTRFNHSFRPDFLKWVSSFLMNCTSGAYDENTRALLELSSLSRSLVDEFIDSHGESSMEYRKSGKLIIYSNGFEKAVDSMEGRNKVISLQRALTPGECCKIEPALSGYSDKFSGGVWAEGDAVGDPYLFCNYLLKHLDGYSNFTFKPQCEVLGYSEANGHVLSVDTSLGKMVADKFVCCLGPQAPVTSKLLGISLPIIPIKGYSVSFKSLEGAPEVSLTDIDRKIVMCKIGSEFRVAGLSEVGEWGEEVGEDKIKLLIDAAQEIFPNASDYSQPYRKWRGIRPFSPNSRPIVGTIKHDNLYFNVGHGMLGWTLSFSTAKLVSDQVLRSTH